MTHSRRLRRRGGIVAAFLAGGVGLFPPDVEIAAWLVITLAAVIVSTTQLVEAHRAVLAAKRAEPLAGESVEQAARRIGALLMATENHRSSEVYRFIAACALLTVGIGAVFRVPGLIAPPLFFVAALIVLNSAIGGLERRELRSALDLETSEGA